MLGIQGDELRAPKRPRKAEKEKGAIAQAFQRLRFDGIDHSFDLVIDRGPYVLNVLKAEAFESRRQLKKIGQPVDRGEWIAGFYPQQVGGFLYF